MTIDLPDFRSMTAEEAIAFFKAQKNDAFGPLIRWIAKGTAFDGSNQNARIAIADGERRVEELTKDDSA